MPGMLCNKQGVKIMRLWTIQPEIIYEVLKSEKVIYCDPSKSLLIIECDFGKAYDWMAAQMRLRIGDPPDGVRYPIWAWYTLYWKNQKPDLRRMEFRNYTGKQVCIELEIPDDQVLLSDEEMWNYILNDSYIGDSTNEEEFDIEYDWFEKLPQIRQKMLKEKSWEKIFDISLPIDTKWHRQGMFIQAVFWELRPEYVVGVRHFKGQKDNHREKDCR